MMETGRLETEERVAVSVQRQSAMEPGITTVADEVQRQSSGEFLAQGRVSLFSIWAFN